MRHVYLSLLILLCGLQASTAEPINLKVTIYMIEKQTFVGSEALFLIKITNNTKHRLFIDDGDLRIQTLVEYPDRSEIFGQFSTRGTVFRSHGGPHPVMHLHARTIGVEPGESILKFSRLEPSMLVHPERVTVRAHVTFPGTFDISIRGEDWSEFEATGEISIQVHKQSTSQSQ